MSHPPPRHLHEVVDDSREPILQPRIVLENDGVSRSGVDQVLPQRVVRQEAADLAGGELAPAHDVPPVVLHPVTVAGLRQLEAVDRLEELEVERPARELLLYGLAPHRFASQRDDENRWECPWHANFQVRHFPSKKGGGFRSGS